MKGVVSMVSWFKSRKKLRKRRHPPRELAPVEDIVEQGLLVADVAVRLSVKNAIIMNALAAHVDYSEEHVCQLVRDALTELADEREADAERLDEVVQEIDRFGHSGWGETDYSRDDDSTLEHRRKVYRAVAATLTERVGDDSYVKKTAERARTDAWAEIGESLKTKAEHPYYGGGKHDDYLEHRQERIQSLIEKDLTRLVQQRQKKKR